MATESLPIRRIGTSGRVDLIGRYEVASRELELTAVGFPLHPIGRATIDGELPWVFDEMAPDGYLAARFARAFPELALPTERRLWTSARVLSAIAERGHDLPGNLVVGEQSWLRHQHAVLHERRFSSRVQAREAFLLGVEELLDEVGASSLGGARPKFSVGLDDGTGLLVKFSPPLDTPTGRRWADLLRVEHHVHEALRGHGVAAVASTVLEQDNRVFLEIERYDRLAGFGRRGAVTLYALGLSMFGEAGVGAAPGICERLHAAGFLSAAEVHRVRELHAFSAAIGNTDAHTGNTGLLIGDDGAVTLAPCYDVSPMVFAPRHDELPDARVKRFAAPTVSVRPWVESLAARVAADVDVSAAFRERFGAALTL